MLTFRSIKIIVYAALAAALAALGCEEGGGTKAAAQLNCPDGQLHSGICAVKIAVDSVGYLPGRAKNATLVGVGPSFELRRADGSLVLSGQGQVPSKIDTSESPIFIADFTS